MCLSLASLHLPAQAVNASFYFLQNRPSDQPVAHVKYCVHAKLSSTCGYRCAISYTSLWYMSTSTATLYSLTGGMNKVIVATAGIILFDESSGWRNLLSIAIGLAAGIVFVFAKATPV